MCTQCVCVCVGGGGLCTTTHLGNKMSFMLQKNNRMNPQSSASEEKLGNNNKNTSSHNVHTLNVLQSSRTEYRVALYGSLNKHNHKTR